jgi:hypothetical protein
VWVLCGVREIVSVGREHLCSVIRVLNYENG